MAVLNEEQTMLRDMARGWVRNESPVKAFRDMRNAGGDRGYAPATYTEMAGMGWAGIIIPEAHGGSDFGWLSLGLVLEECGKTLTASPLLASSIATAAINLAGSDAQKATWLPGIASGDIVATLAVDDGPLHDPANIATTARKVGDGWTLDGTKAFVAEGMAADLFVVAAGTDDGPAIFLVPGDAAGVTRSVRKMVDSRGHAEIALSGVKLGDDALLAVGTALLDNVLDRARILTAAEMLGVAQQAFDMTHAYLQTRVQFGQVIGTFQALQHRAAKLFTEIELMRSAVEGALEALDAGASDVSQAASLAKATANDVLHLVSRETIQLHGGIGMTDEHDAGFYLKRARSLENAWGNAAFHRERFARLNGY